MSTRRLLAPLALAALVTLVAASCGRLNDSGGGGTIDHPTGADELVLRVSVGGGLVPPSYMLRLIPSWSLFGDGRLITQGPQIEIYPGPALPNLLVTPISEDGVQAILAATRDAGLMVPDADYPYPCIMDAPGTTFTLVAEGDTHVVSAYALGMDQGPCPDVDREARAALAAFQSKLGDLASWLPEGSIGQEVPFDPSEMRVYAQRYAGHEDPNLAQAGVVWPLATPLASFGEPTPDLPDTRCGAVGGQDLATLLPEAERSNELTPWTSDGKEYLLIFRPLLPDEHGC